jgi:general secretion pathway protein D
MTRTSLTLLSTLSIVSILPSPAAAVPAAESDTAAPGPPRGRDGRLPGEAAFNQCLKLAPGRKVKVSLKPGSELKDLVAWISGMTCKRFIIGGGARSQPVTLISPTPISAGEAYHAFISALEVMGLTVVRSGRFLKIVPGNWAIQSAVPTFTDGQRAKLPPGEVVVTQLLKVRHARVDQLLAVLQKMKSRSGDVAAYLPGRTLILTDAASNVRRMVHIVEELDLEAKRADIWVLRPRHADPAELAKLLGELFSSSGSAASGGGGTPAATPGGGADSSAAPRFLLDTASGSLIVVATAPAFRRVREVVTAVDVESGVGRPRAWIYRLKHGDAQQLATELSGLGASARGGGTTKRRGRAPAPSTTPAGQTALFEGDVQVTAIKATNSLMVVASTRDYLKLRRVLKEIDRPRRQVFIEAYVLDVGLKRERDIGIAMHGGKRFDTTTVLGGTSHGSLNSLGLPTDTLGGLTLGIQGELLGEAAEALGLGDIPSFGVVLTALQQNSDVNLLSSPHLLTTDNEEAEISVGQVIPMRGSGAALPTTTGTGENQQQLNLLANLVPSVERVDVGLTLKLTPTIGDGDTVRLKLEQKAEDVDEKSLSNLGPSTSKKQIRTTITLRDRQPVVIGGLIDERTIVGESKVPVLGDIPILGRLFRREMKTTQKRNLLVVLTPHIIRSQADLRRISVQKQRERKEFLRRYTALRERAGLQEVDYRYKRGLLAEIDHVGARVEEDRRLAEQARIKTEKKEVVHIGD